ncbi:hypothetical protein [Janibacter cremeus]|uniref:Uncharacterized protein n=1 Tax=Janibacter cremeus TaxID=1285192 RepID=A0A852VM13_9MICO|nr:hypothetical protein [Janibacter cremeus]NYF96648.1 hypothetical protein [Janibacter cremeus]
MTAKGEGGAVTGDGEADRTSRLIEHVESLAGTRRRGTAWEMWRRV